MRILRRLGLALACLAFGATFDTAAFAQVPNIKIARLKYRGGGDWYGNVTSLPNLISFANKNLGTNLAPNEAVVEVGSPEIFQYPFVHMTGHGNVTFNEAEVENIRAYCKAGGFIHMDDNYGMDKFLRPQLLRMFPGATLVELPPSHPIFHQKFDFAKGLPKVHEHDGKPPQAFGIELDGRLVLVYTYESDLGNGWEDASIYNDPPALHEAALRMGANLLQYAFTH